MAKFGRVVGVFRVLGDKALGLGFRVLGGIRL